MVHQLVVSLEDLYKGATRKLAVHKNVICERCEGKSFTIQCELKHVFILWVGIDSGGQSSEKFICAVKASVLLIEYTPYLAS